MRCPAWVGGLLAALLTWTAEAGERGVAIGLFSAESTFDYRPAVREVAALGATHVALANTYWLEDLRADEIGPLTGWTASDAQVQAAAAEARRLGMSVTLFPILRLIRADKGEWRGTIAPRDEDRWWAAYGTWMLDQARLARAIGARRLCIGSELASRESARARWLALIDRLRVAAPELELLYSANWDHFEQVTFWDAVDVVGVTAYFELAKTPEASDAELHAAAEAPRRALASFARALGRPILITEFGFPSLDGAAMFPWDQTRRAPIDLEEQARGYRAVLDVIGRAGFVSGVYAWAWFGPGGARDGEYTPRGKPAEQVLRRFFAEGAR